MMLRHEKPLAVFSDADGFFPAPALRYLRMFDRHAGAGTFVRREDRTLIEVRGKPGILLTIYYALPEEAWRIGAMIELRRLRSQPWTEEQERTEGTLLGYTDAQNNAWIARGLL